MEKNLNELEQLIVDTLYTFVQAYDYEIKAIVIQNTRNAGIYVIKIIYKYIYFYDNSNIRYIEGEDLINILIGKRFMQVIDLDKIRNILGSNFKVKDIHEDIR